MNRKDLQTRLYLLPVGGSFCVCTGLDIESARDAAREWGIENRACVGVDKEGDALRVTLADILPESPLRRRAGFMRAGV